MMWLWRRLFRHRDKMTNHAEDVDLVDAQKRMKRLEQKAADGERRRRVAQVQLDARRRHP